MPRHHSPAQASTTVQGVFAHLIYSPKGQIEGMILDAESGPLQLVVAHGDEKTARVMKHLSLASRSARVLNRKSRRTKAAALTRPWRSRRF